MRCVGIGIKRILFSQQLRPCPDIRFVFTDVLAVVVNHPFFRSQAIPSELS